ncbi:MAG: hypothetical protein IJ203_13015 [Atopobiaceae bacterium]|nr:hypothetical protein [Atopobiaceae bacterium]
MPAYTERYRLAKPGYDEPVDIQVINRNMDAIDAEMARNADEDVTLSIVTNQQILSLFEEDEHA